MERRAGAVENGNRSPWRVAIIYATGPAFSPAPNNGSELGTIYCFPENLSLSISSSVSSVLPAMKVNETA